MSTGYPLVVGFAFVMGSAGAVLLWFRESTRFLKVVGIAVLPAGLVPVARA